MTRAILLLFVLASPALAAPTPTPPLWAGLQPGDFAVGFRQIEHRDHARPFWTARALDGRPREHDLARPIRISVWYPAKAADGPALTVGDYVALMGIEDRLGPLTSERARVGEAAFFGLELMRDLDTAQRQRLLGLSGVARRDAPAAPGRYPVILYSLGSAAIGNVTPEYLASHGYIVAQAPRLGAYAGLLPENRDMQDLITKLADLDQVVNALATLPGANVDAMAAIGFSAGGRWALQAAMTHAAVRAVVSLDSVMLFDDAWTRMWRTHPQFNLDAVRVPVLHAIRKEWVPRQDPTMWSGMRYAERLALQFDDAALAHLDFQSSGLAQALAGGRPAKLAAVRAAFATWNRYTLEFLDAHLAGRDAARRFLARSPEANGARDVVATRIAAAPAPLTSAIFFNAMAADGPLAAVEAVRRASRSASRPAVSEADLILAGYVLLFGQRQKESLPVFEAAAELYPRSANVEDSLGDAYLALDDKPRARQHTDAAQRLLDADKELPAERRAAIQKSIDEKRPQLR